LIHEDELLCLKFCIISGIVFGTYDLVSVRNCV
jgi:hypothetical protein